MIDARLLIIGACRARLTIIVSVRLPLATLSLLDFAGGTTTEQAEVANLVTKTDDNIV